MLYGVCKIKLSFTAYPILSKPCPSPALPILSSPILRCPILYYHILYYPIYSSERGIYVIGFNFPVVPRGEARIRVQISACHTEEDIDRAVEAFTAVGKELHVIE